MRSYILCTSPRSGSTLLCRLLEKTGVAGCPNSYFHRTCLTQWSTGINLPPETILPDILRAAISEGTGDTDVFGLRLQRQSAAFFWEQLRILHPSAATDHDAIVAAFGPTRYIYLTREDKLAQAVSFLRAEQSGLWHAHADGRPLEELKPTRDTGYDRAATAAQIAAFETYESEWRTWFSAQRIVPLRVTYDALAADPSGTTGRVLSFLDLDPAHASDISVPTAKLADEESEAWATRFRAETLATDTESP